MTLTSEAGKGSTFRCSLSDRRPSSACTMSRVVLDCRHRASSMEGGPDERYYIRRIGCAQSDGLRGDAESGRPSMRARRQPGRCPLLQRRGGLAVCGLGAVAWWPPYLPSGTLRLLCLPLLFI